MEISVTRVLAEIKLTEKKIEKKISHANIISPVVGQEPPTGFKSIEEFTQHVQNLWKSIQDLITYRNKLKCEVIKSNAVTPVTIGTKTMTVAEAIDQKSVMEKKTQLLRVMQTEKLKVEKQVESENKQVDTRLDYLLAQHSNKDSRVKKEDLDFIAKPFLEMNQWKICDPIHIQSKIEHLRDEIDEFLLNVDFALSESNATTKIEI